MENMFKFPRTAHLEGSRLQPGDDTSAQVKYEAKVAGRYIVAKEKMDGANTGKQFSSEAVLYLQSRGHYLVGGGRERHFNRFKQWAHQHQDAFFDRLGDQYLNFLEDCSCKHTVFYNRLPHYFFQFDTWDKSRKGFLSTDAQRRLLAGLPILSVPVLYEGIAPPTLKEFLALMPKWSNAKGPGWQEQLRKEAKHAGVDPDQAMDETWQDDGPEGIYVTIEEGDLTLERFKWVRRGFSQTLDDSDSHWHDRPIIRNLLVDGADLDSPNLMVTWENLPYLPKLENLLSRDQFREQTLGLFNGKCCLCPKPAVDAHHILDRKLFKDGGYYAENGAPLCANCHLAAEESHVSVEAIRAACNIVDPVLVPGLFPGRIYDKWGNPMRP